MKITPPNITPGDWIESQGRVISSICEEIATCPPVFIFGEEKANVQAIAALPELLKALESALDLISELNEGGAENPEEQEIIEALTKAGYTIEP